MYINADELMNRLRKLCDTTDCNIAIMPDVFEVLRDMPQVDADAMQQRILELGRLLAKARAERDEMAKCIRYPCMVCANRVNRPCKHLRCALNYYNKFVWAEWREGSDKP